MQRPIGIAKPSFEDLSVVVSRQRTLETDQLHDLRRLIKRLLYNEKALQFSKEVIQNPSDVLLTEVLGDWHDTEMVIENLQHTLSNKSLVTDEKKHLQQTIVELSKKRRILLEKIKLVIPGTEFLKAVPTLRPTHA